MSEQLINKIRAGGFNRKELENLYANAERLGRQEILQAAKEALREIDSRSYSKRFVKPIRDKVKQIIEELASENNWGDWPDNQVGNGIKAGGPMLNGKVLAEFYISYRHAKWKRSTYLVAFQQDEHSVVMYKVKAHDAENEILVETSEAAVKLFASSLQR